MFKQKYIPLFALMVIGSAGFLACTDELKLNEDGGNNSNLQTSILRAEIYFEDYKTATATRFGTDTTDRWSIGNPTTFTNTDTVGIFARWGNMNLPTKDGRGGPIINIPMYFVAQQYPSDPNKPNGATTTKYTMENDTVEVYPPGMITGNGLFMYYPYTPDIGNIDNYPNWREYVDAVNITNGSIYWDNGYNGDPEKMYPAIPGLELRVKAPDGSVRCREVVQMWSATTSELTKGVISGAVYHAFSELIIVRGDGFDNPMSRNEQGELVPNDSIWVELNTPITHMRVVTYSDWVRWTTQLFYQENYEFDGKPMSEEEAKKWYAWEGAPYPYTGFNEDNPRRRAWYVMVPTIYHQNNTASWQTNTNRLYNSQYSTRPTVMTIYLYDNEGILQPVTSFTLKTSDTAGATKSPYPYYRWPIEISMDELGPTVRPIYIDYWDENGPDKDITDVRTVGIHDFQQYKDWSEAYYAYIYGGRKAEDEQELLKYGDKEGDVWHFYVSEFDFSTVSEPMPYVEDLQDVIEGINQLNNIEWSNLNLTAPLFNRISGKGGIRYIDFTNLIFNSDSLDPVGALAGSVASQYGGADDFNTFEKCNIIYGRVKSAGPTGLLSGTVDYVRIKDCDFSGSVSGPSTSDSPKYLFGSNPTETIYINNSTYNRITFSQR